MRGVASEPVAAEDPSTLVWVTRGRTWGFRFLLNGGFLDPLPVYDAVFSGADDAPEVWRRLARTVALRFPDRLGRQHRVAEAVALRFPDPDRRQDAAGRVITHDFVLFPPLADRINSVEDGLRLVWPQVRERYEEVWDQSSTPPANG